MICQAFRTLMLRFGISQKAVLSLGRTAIERVFGRVGEHELEGVGVHIA